MNSKIKLNSFLFVFISKKLFKKTFRSLINAKLQQIYMKICSFLSEERFYYLNRKEFVSLIYTFFKAKFN